MRILWAANVDRAAHSAPRIGATLPVLLALENRKYIGEGPTLGSVFCPPVVVPLHAPHPHHGVDAGPATKYVTECHVEIPVVQSRQRVDGQVVIERPADIVKPYTWIQYRRCVVWSSRLDHEDLRAGGGQFSRQDRTSRARSHHDEVISLSRYVSHFELPKFEF